MIKAYFRGIKFYNKIICYTNLRIFRGKTTEKGRLVKKESRRVYPEIPL